MDQKTINRIERVIASIEENAKLATPGPWSISHGQVIKHEYEKAPAGSTVVNRSFDIACGPWESRMTVYGVNPRPQGSFPDMRHIATCEPRRMLQLVEDIRALLQHVKA